MIRYRFEVEGLTAQGITWKTAGETAVEKEGEFFEAVNNAMRDSFMALTKGKAQFVQPGVGCSGPYRFTKLTIEKIPDAD